MGNLGDLALAFDEVSFDVRCAPIIESQERCDNHDHGCADSPKAPRSLPHFLEEWFSPFACFEKDIEHPGYYYAESHTWRPDGNKNTKSGHCCFQNRPLGVETGQYQSG